MARRFAPLLVRAGAILGIVAFFAPRFEYRFDQGVVRSDWSSCVELVSLDLPAAIGIVPFLVAPLVGCILVLGASIAGDRASAFLRGALVVFFFLWTFCLATAGSILATDPAGRESDETGATIFLFGTPLLMATIVLARVLGGSESRSNVTLLLGALGLFLLVHSIHLIRFPLVARWTVWAMLPILGGALVMLGAILSRSGPGGAAPFAGPAVKAP